MISIGYYEFNNSTRAWFCVKQSLDTARHCEALVLRGAKFNQIYCWGIQFFSLAQHDVEVSNLCWQKIGSNILSNPTFVLWCIGVNIWVSTLSRLLFYSKFLRSFFQNPFSKFGLATFKITNRTHLLYYSSSKISPNT